MVLFQHFLRTVFQHQVQKKGKIVDQTIICNILGATLGWDEVFKMRDQVIQSYCHLCELPFNLEEDMVSCHCNFLVHADCYGDSCPDAPR